MRDPKIARIIEGLLTPQTPPVVLQVTRPVWQHQMRTDPLFTLFKLAEMATVETAPDTTTAPTIDLRPILTTADAEQVIQSLNAVHLAIVARTVRHQTTQQVPSAKRIGEMIGATESLIGNIAASYRATGRGNSPKYLEALRKYAVQLLHSRSRAEVIDALTYLQQTPNPILTPSGSPMPSPDFMMRPYNRHAGKTDTPEPVTGATSTWAPSEQLSTLPLMHAPVDWSAEPAKTLEPAATALPTSEPTPVPVAEPPRVVKRAWMEKYTAAVDTLTASAEHLETVIETDVPPVFRPAMRNILNSFMTTLQEFDS